MAVLVAAFTYFCSGCGAQARKDAVKASKEADATLGTWRCTGSCKGKTKVKREKVR